MKNLGWLLVAVVVLGAGAVQARPKAPVPPDAVVKAAQQLVIDAWPQPEAGDDPADFPPPPPAMPDAKTVRTWIKDGVLRPIKLSPGKGQDWLIDTEKMEHGGYFCGTGGCEIEIWTPRAGGRYGKIFDQQIRQYQFRWIGKTHRTWMNADFHGSLCGKTGVEACPWGFEWRDDGLGHFGLWSSWRFAHGEVIHPGPPPQSVDPLLDPAGSTVPDFLLRRLADGKTACAGWQADFSQDGAINRLPDLNGDGIDDWSYEGSMTSCVFAPDTESASGESSNPHAGDDACTILDCDTEVWVSRKEATGATWVKAPLDPAHVFAIRWRKGRIDLVQLNDPPAYPDSCDTYDIDNCDLQPISLSPKP